jgi:glycosyltransferase involved in cell wall biosynthesis
VTAVDRLEGMTNTSVSLGLERDSGTDVLITTTAFGGGGTERYVEDLAIGLAERNVRVAVTVDSGPFERVRRLLLAGIPLFALGAGPLSASRYVTAFRAVLERIRPRLIHTNAWAHHEEIADVAFSCRIPMVCTNHCTPRKPLFRERLGLNRVPFALYRQRASARRTGLAISISHLGFENLRARLGDRVSSLVIYNGVPPVEAPKTYLSKSAVPQVAWVGSLIERKRPLLAIEVFERVLRVHPTAELVILGDGPLLPDVRAASERLPREAVHIRGYCGTVLDALRSADVYLQTSANEGLAYSVLDAMSVGLPVIATDVGATREAVLHERTGLLCNVGDAVGLAKSIVQVLGSPGTIESYGQEGLQRARNVFGLDRMVAETLCAYDRVLRESTTPSLALTQQAATLSAAAPFPHRNGDTQIRAYHAL